MKRTLCTILSVLLAFSSAMLCLPMPAIAEEEIITENYALSRQAAEEGIVLLENNGALPLASTDSVSLFGVGQINFIKGGTGSGLINTVYSVTLLDGMKKANTDNRITLNTALSDVYEAYVTENGASATEKALTDDEIAAARLASNTAVYTVSRIQGEGSDRKAIAGDYYISETEAANLRKINDADFDNFIVVLNVGTVVDTSFIADYPNIDSVVLTWLPGVEGGYALTNVLLGDVNPSGKLVDTFAKSYDDYPSSATFAENNYYVNYTEDIFVGYRYFETFDPTYSKVNYEFGYGLSYTTFAISDDSVTNDGTNITVSATVTNTGSIAGKEVVQVYYAAPQGTLGNPAKELAGYAKTSLLAPSESEDIEITFPISDMASFDDRGKSGHKSAYVLEAGNYDIFVGNSVKNAGTRGTKGTYTVASTVVAEQLTSLLTPKSLEKRLLADGTYEKLDITTADDGSILLNSETAVMKVEAEDYFTASSGVTTPVLPAQENLKYVSGLTSGGYVTYDFTSSEAMVFGLKLAFSNAGSTVSNPIKLYVNNVEQQITALSVANTGTTPDNFVFTQSSSVILTVPEGKFTLKIEYQSDSSLDLDYLLFEKKDDFPIISAAEETTVMAADFVNFYDTSSNVVSAVTKNGQSCIIYLDGAGTYVEYYLSVEVAGTYDMYFKYSQGGSSVMNSPYTISVNGENIGASYTMNGTTPEGVTSASNATAYWYTFAEIGEAIPVTLPKGNIVFRITTAGGASPNLAYMRFVPKAPTVPDKHTVIPEDESVTIESELILVPATTAYGSYGAGTSGNLVSYATRNNQASKPVCVVYLSPSASDTSPRYLEYNLYAEKAGSYDLTLNYAGSSSYTAPFEFYVGDSETAADIYSVDSEGNAATTVGYTLATTNSISLSEFNSITGSYASTTPEWKNAIENYYYNFIDSQKLRITLPAGAFTFRIKPVKGAPNLNYMTFAPVTASPEIVPDDCIELSASESVKIENELVLIPATATYGSYGTGTSGNLVKYLTRSNQTSKPVCVVYLSPIASDTTPRYLEYNLYAKKAGNYDIKLNYSGSSSYTAPFEFYVGNSETAADIYSVDSEGNAATTVGYTLAPTNSITSSEFNSITGSYANTTPEWKNAIENYYYNFIDSQGLRITLPKGRVTLRIKAVKGAPNLDYMTVTPSDPDSSLSSINEEKLEVDTSVVLDETDTASDYSDTIGTPFLLEEVYFGRKTMDEFVAQMTNAELAIISGGQSPVVGNGTSSMGRMRKFGIPAMNTADGGAGLRLSPNACATCWPCSTMLACTWNLPLIHSVGEAAGREAAENRVDAWLAPGLNIHRNPLCGRNFEYYSEDPLIAGNCAAEITLGVKTAGVYTVPKHFAANNKEAGRSVSDSRVSERALREIYLKGFEILVKKSDPMYMMASYNLINGTKTADNKELMTDILRNEWGFSGLVMTDWQDGGSNQILEINAGTNIKKAMGNPNDVLDALIDGRLTRAKLKDNAKAILGTVLVSLSMQKAVNTPNISVTGTTTIEAEDFNYCNDDFAGTATVVHNTTYYAYDVGDIVLVRTWNPCIVYGATRDTEYVTVSKPYSNENVSFDNSEYFLEYNFNILEDNYYDFGFTWMDTGKTVKLYLDGEEYRTAGDPATVQAQLTEGKHSLKIAGVTSYNLDKITVKVAETPEIDCAVLNKGAVRSALYRTVETLNEEYASYTPDYTQTAVPKLDKHSFSVDIDKYKYMKICYRTTYAGSMSLSVLQTSTAVQTLTFNPEKTGAWTSNTLALSGSGNITQYHFSIFGNNNANTLPEGTQIDIKHIAFFKTLADAENYCSCEAPTGVSGSIAFVARESGISPLNGNYAKIRFVKSGETEPFTEKPLEALDTVSNIVAFEVELPTGEYTYTIEKNGYVSTTGSATVTDGCTDIGSITLTSGDIKGSFSDFCGDGKVDIDDFIRLLRGFASGASSELKNAIDINEDTFITVEDLSYVKANIG